MSNQEKSDDVIPCKATTTKEINNRMHQEAARVDIRRVLKEMINNFGEPGSVMNLRMRMYAGYIKRLLKEL